MYLAVGKVETQRLHTYFIFSRTIVLGHNANFDAIHLRMQYFNCERKLACLWNFCKFENVPQLVAADFNHFFSFHFEKFSKKIFIFIWIHCELYRVIECLYLRGLLLLYLLLLDCLWSQNCLFRCLLFSNLLSFCLYFCR
jgi:hypothetical protein